MQMPKDVPVEVRRCGVGEAGLETDLGEPTVCSVCMIFEAGRLQEVTEEKRAKNCALGLLCSVFEGRKVGRNQQRRLRRSHQVGRRS